MITLKLRLKDKYSSDLIKKSEKVSFVWNYCNETQMKAVRSNRKWLSAFDFNNLTSGSSKFIDLNAQSIQEICRVYDTSRRTSKKPYLKWRSRKRSLGWIPFSGQHIKFNGKAFRFMNKEYEPMHLHPLLTNDVKLCSGSFNQDAKGRWYINIPIEVDEAKETPNKKIGIDLGLKSLIATSDGLKIENPKFFRESEREIAVLQKRKSKADKKNKRKFWVKTRTSKKINKLHNKIKNKRKDFLHKLSHNIVKENGLIFVGDVSLGKLAKTKFAKSVYDASWYSFKNMLSYKALKAGGKMIEVNEAMSTQTCSSCGSKDSMNKPKGITGLGIREWKCTDCGTTHDRDINAALNILRMGQHTLAEGAGNVRS